MKNNKELVQKHVKSQIDLMRFLLLPGHDKNRKSH